MSLYRDALPQLGDELFITDGGLETVMVFLEGIDLPEFAAYDLLRTPADEARLLAYYRPYLDLARQHSVGLLLETPTWRANRDWGRKIGDDIDTLHELNRRAADLMVQLREELEDHDRPIVISGQMGPRGDGYQPDHAMTADEASDYHAQQVATFADTAVDMVSALTLNYIDEAIGVTRAAMAAGLPVCISFTVETDGRLPTGQTLQQAIDTVDEATDEGPVYYQINCAHPTHFDAELHGDDRWLNRIRGIRGNASRMSHEELDNSETLDDGHPEEFGQQLATMRTRLPQLTVLGGCCGTDHRHIEQICLHARRAT
ncbi:MAG: homocysteine S-methyltransferase family protein [Chromatiales bacterium]|nr:MAG: homocysteine S-methyltransferase family protein [Chromatiales bacterium]